MPGREAFLLGTLIPEQAKYLVDRRMKRKTHFESASLLVTSELDERQNE